MKKLLLILAVTGVSVLNAQDYKVLSEDEVLVIRNTDNNYNMRILKKDSTALATGYYSAPFEKENSKISFYIAPNGKLNQTLKIENSSISGTIPFKDDLADGMLTAYKDGKLLMEAQFDNGVLKMSKKYKEDRRTEEIFSQGKPVSEKVFENDVLIYHTAVNNGKTLTKEYKNGKLISSYDQATETTLNYDEKGTLLRSIIVAKNGDKTTKEFSISGKLTMQQDYSGATGDTMTRYYDINGRLKETEEVTAIKVTHKNYDAKGKVIRTQSYDVLGPPTMKTD